MTASLAAGIPTDVHATPWTLRNVGRDGHGRAVYAVHAHGRLIGRLLQCRKADGSGGVGFVLFLYGETATARAYLPRWTDVHNACRARRNNLRLRVIG